MTDVPVYKITKNVHPSGYVTFIAGREISNLEDAMGKAEDLLVSPSLEELLDRITGMLLRE